MDQYNYQRQKMISSYDVTTNSKGRELINRVLMPRFAQNFKDGDRILSVGKHPLWDYSVFFNGPHKQCEYIVSDIEPEIEPDVVDNIAESQFDDNSFNGVIAIGLYDSLKGEGVTPEKVTAGITRILKPGGRLFVALTGRKNGSYDPAASWPNFYVDEVYYIWGDNMVEIGRGWYGEGDNQAIFLVLRKK